MTYNQSHSNQTLSHISRKYYNQICPLFSGFNAKLSSTYTHYMTKKPQA